LITAPEAYFCSISFQGSSVVCFKPSDTLFLSLSKSSTITLISSPTATISEGCDIFFQLMSAIWSRPSIPPKSTKAPKFVILLTFPFRISLISSSFHIFSRDISLSSLIALLRERIKFCLAWVIFTTWK